MSKLLFIHTSKPQQPQLIFMPLGLLSLADYLQNNNHETKIINTFVEEKVNPKFNILTKIEQENPNFICLSLHWHFQSSKVIDLAKEIKEKHPDKKIVLGGFTSSYFAEEILNNFDFIDFITRGESEVPLLNLADKKLLNEIPNLAYRENNKVKLNPVSFKANHEILDKLSFTNISLLENYETYLKFGLDETDEENKWLFIYNPGRGCPVQCSFCSGGCDSQERMTGRKVPIFTKIEKAVEEIKKLSEIGLGVWYCAFDPYPLADYYVKLFKKLRENNVSIRCKFESWGLPSPEFIEEFSKTFQEGSEIVISPESGSEKVREKNKGYNYDNNTLIDCIDFLVKKNIGCVAYFTAGLPYENINDFKETLVLVNFIRTNYPSVKISAMPIEVEPNSPSFENPGKFGITKNRSSFDDFYKVHKEQSSVGYRTENFSEKEILEIVNLINVEANCLMKNSVFLKFLSQSNLEKKFNISELWNLCNICKHFKRCFS